ncbi:MAG TPA: CehA/McbA family metallohydrolase [Candidatus Krumholzibacteria bacterium]|nr:CehA/McbA family metallohydrolase [Candidatus Krumholzibacteria bacterium]
MRCPTAYTAKLLLLCIGLLAGTASVAASAQVLLTLQFRDQSGPVLPVRAGVFNGSTSCPPVDPAAHLYQFIGAYSHFCCDGNVQVNVSTGPVTIRAGHGFEYVPLDTTLQVSQAATLTLTLRRFANMNSLGWYSADTHAHITHQPLIYTLGASDLLLAMKAEDLNYTNAMEEQSNFRGAIEPVSEANRIIHFSKEDRNAHFSHLAILGLRQWIPDPGCSQQGVLCGVTLDKYIHQVVHAQAGETAVIATHPYATTDMNDTGPWPGGGMWRGMAIDLPAGAVDAMDLLTYTNAMPPACVASYFEALNAGFHLPPSAGTDCALGWGFSKPLGGYRTYVHTTGAFTMDSWIVAFKAGRSFVSNYPLFTHLDVEGKEPGETVANGSKPQLRVTVTATCALPIQKIEIIGNTGTLQTITAAGGSARTISGAVDVPRDGLTWIVARATGTLASPQPWHPIDASGLFAQTGPVYVLSDPASHGSSAEAAIHFLSMVDGLEATFNALGYFPLQTRAAFDQALQDARAFYLAITVPTAVPSSTPKAPWAITELRPNPSASVTRIGYSVPPGASAHTVKVYDTAGRFVRSLFSGVRASGGYELEWDGRDDRAKTVPSGVYFVRIQPQNAAAVTRKMIVMH